MSDRFDERQHMLHRIDTQKPEQKAIAPSVRSTCPHTDWTIRRRWLFFRWPHCSACGAKALRWID